MLISRIRPALAALALAWLIAPAVRANIITTSMDTSTPIMTFNIPSKGVNGESGYVGPNSVSFNGSAPVSAYCTDLFRSIGVNDSYSASLQPLSDLANGDFVARLFVADASHAPSALEGAALQLAIWDVVETGRAGLGSYIDPLSFSSADVSKGSDHFDVYTSASHSTLLFGLSSSDLVVYAADGSGVLNRMDDLLVAAAGLSGPGAALTYIEPTTSYGQGFVSVTNVRAVPEPSSLVLAGLGLAGMLGRRFRRRGAR